jgi:NAD-dependent dihydropyrimidine dehydrogenase PreA subunit
VILRQPVHASTLSLDDELCSGCGRCAEVCPHGVFDTAGPTAEIVRGELCMECGACALNCPREAVTVRKGVGCAAAILTGLLRGTAPSCGCDTESCGGDERSKTGGSRNRGTCC